MILKKCSHGTDGTPYSSVGVQQCSVYPYMVYKSGAGWNHFQPGECFKWDYDTVGNGHGIMCLVAYSTIPVDTAAVIHRAPKVCDDCGWDSNNNGIPTCVDCDGTPWTGNKRYICDESTQQTGCSAIGSNNPQYNTSCPSPLPCSFDNILDCMDNCTYDSNMQYGCTDYGQYASSPYPGSPACNYDSNATFHCTNNCCDYSCYGCTDSNATNFNPTSIYDDGSCVYPQGRPIRIEFVCPYGPGTVQQAITGHTMPSATDFADPNYLQGAVNHTVDNGNAPQIGDYIQIITGGSFMGAAVQTPPLVAKIIDVAPRSQNLGGDFDYPIGDPNTPCKSWNCKKSKFGNYCQDPGDGTGLYNSLATCQGFCIEHQAHEPDQPIGLGVDDLVSPVNPTLCSATMNYNQSTGHIEINFSGPVDYAWELYGPHPTGNIIFLANGNTSAQTTTINALNPGSYTLNYQCGVQANTPLTYPHEATLYIPQLLNDPGGDEIEDLPPTDKTLDTNSYLDIYKNFQK